MRGQQVDILLQRAGALTALALLSLLSACASAPIQPSVMALGAQAPAPMGYLEFCARRPEQCGLPQVIDASGAPIDTEHRAQDLRRRYYWSIALAGATTPPPTAPTPASGGGAPGVRSVDLTMWRAGPATGFDTRAPRIESATWRGAELLLQPAVLVTPLPEITRLAPATTDPFASGAGPAPVDRADDPFNLRDADADAPKAVQPMVVTPLAMTLLNAVNRRVNDSIHYASAQALYGNDDYWTLPLEAGGLRAGDCKDYVLEKRKALVEQGVPAGDMSIAVVMLRTGVAHAVLLLATDRGELVLDSLSSWILPWNQLDYRWISRQAPGQQLVWVKVEQPGRG
jgi:predicted transglutaminase-like cysteine proteinase